MWKYGFWSGNHSTKCSPFLGNWDSSCICDDRPSSKMSLILLDHFFVLFCFSWFLCLFKLQLEELKNPQNSVELSRGKVSLFPLSFQEGVTIFQSPAHRTSLHGCAANRHKPVCGVHEADCASHTIFGSIRNEWQCCYNPHISHKERVHSLSGDIQVPEWQLQNIGYICTENKFPHRSAKCNKNS